MRRQLVLLPLLLSLGCASIDAIQPQFSFGAVSNSIDEQTLGDVVPAHIYEIDGEVVHHAKRTFALTPGEHRIRVWPQGPAQRMVPDLELIQRERIQVDPIILYVVPGYRYVLAAEWSQSRDVVTVISEEDSETVTGDWVKTVRPVVLRELPPPTVEAAVKGAAGFFGSLLLGPLLGGGAAFGSP